MAEKRVLLAVAEPSAGEALRDALGKQWMVSVVASGTAALAELKQQPFQVVVADLDLPDLDGASLLQQVRKKYPKTTRFILAAESERDRVMKKVLGSAHQFLVKPLDRLALKSAVEQAAAANEWVPSDKMRELVGRIRAFPTAPSLYLELVHLLKSPDASTQEVGDLLGKDMALMTKLLQVINSSYFGLPRRITEPAEAVGILGFETVTSVVMAVKVLSQYERFRPAYLSIEQLWRHSQEVAQGAKELSVLATGGRSLAALAYTGGLLHDLGKVVLAANFDEQYSGAYSLAHKLQVPLWQIEKEVFGASHAEIGAYVFGLWGMPPELIETVAFHHEPCRSTNDEFSALTAVHVANVIQCESGPDAQGLAAPQVDEDYLAAIGCLDRLEIWRAALAKRDSAEAPAEVGPTEKVAATPDTTVQEPVVKPPAGPSAQSDPPKLLPELTPPELIPATGVPEPALQAPAQPEQTVEAFAIDMPASAPPVESTGPVLEFEPPLATPEVVCRRRPRPWLWAAAAASLLLALANWLAGGLWPNQPQPVRARTAPKASIAAPARSPASPKPPASKTPQPALMPSAAGEHSQPPAITPAKIADAVPSPIREGVSNKAAQPPPDGSAAERVFAGLRLQGIFYSPDSPSAIVNGKLVRPHDQVGGAVVVEIVPGHVTVEFEHRRKTLFVN